MQQGIIKDTFEQVIERHIAIIEKTIIDGSYVVESHSQGKLAALKYALAVYRECTKQSQEITEEPNLETELARLVYAREQAVGIELKRTNFKIAELQNRIDYAQRMSNDSHK